jgi:hypothetical protein
MEHANAPASAGLSADALVQLQDFCTLLQIAVRNHTFMDVIEVLVEAEVRTYQI